MIHLKLPISIHKKEDFFIAVCREFHISSQGKTEEEALFNIKEVLEVFLKDKNMQKKFAVTIEEHRADNLDSILDFEIDDSMNK
ncbi:MAG: type II toxin-antitoxin system HicB family antitoxin [Methanobacterium sp.]